jgi:hypothetical protein
LTRSAKAQRKLKLIRLTYRRLKMPPLLHGALPSDANFWAALRDGQDLSGNPLRIDFTCEVVRDWRGKDADRLFEKGIAGKILALNDHSASVGFEGMNQAYIVPREILKGGPVRWGTWTTKGIDKSLNPELIRQDELFEVPESNKLVGIVNFRTATQKTTAYNRQPGTTNQSIIEWFNISWFDDENGKMDHWRIASVHSDTTIAEGIDIPPRDTVYEIVFEVRLDGKSHSMSYFRGPEVPVFLNSSIADSWALRIEWKDPNGQHRSRYIQPTETQYNWNYPGAARGASEHHLRCISLIHYLFNVPYPDLESAYIDMGAARVVQGHRNFFLQETTYGAQTPYPNPIVYARVSDQRQIQMMKDGGLQRVNIPYSDRPEGPERTTPANCDSCQLEATYAVSQNASCIEKTGVGRNVCERCYDVFGRAACSFTPNMRWRNIEDKPYRDKFRPLLHMPDRIEHAIDTVDPDARRIPELDEEEEDVSDGEKAFL